MILKQNPKRNSLLIVYLMQKISLKIELNSFDHFSYIRYNYNLRSLIGIA